MEVEFAFLADGAQADPSGKLHVIGGGIDRIFAPQFPARHGLLTLVLKLKLHPAECGRLHKLEIQMWDRDGTRLGPQIEAEFNSERPPKMRPGQFQTVLQMFGLEFPKADEYAFQIVIDGQHRKTIPLYVERLDGSQSGPAATEDQPPDASET